MDKNGIVQNPLRWIIVNYNENNWEYSLITFNQPIDGDPYNLHIGTKWCWRDDLEPLELEKNKVVFKEGISPRIVTKYIS